MIYVGAAVLAGLLVISGCALIRPSSVRVSVAATLAVGWLFVNQRWEGPVLWVPIHGHGLTLSDLLTPVTLALLVGRVLGTGRRSSTPT